MQLKRSEGEVKPHVFWKAHGALSSSACGVPDHHLWCLAMFRGMIF